jgi:hypothetical protein
MYYTLPLFLTERTHIGSRVYLFVSAPPTPELWAVSAFVHATRQSQARKITFSSRAAGKVLPQRAPPPHQRESRRESDKLQSQTRGGLIALQLARAAAREREVLGSDQHRTVWRMAVLRCFLARQRWFISLWLLIDCAQGTLAAFSCPNENFISARDVEKNVGFDFQMRLQLTAESATKMCWKKIWNWFWLLSNMKCWISVDNGGTLAHLY